MATIIVSFCLLQIIICATRIVVEELWLDPSEAYYLEYTFSVLSNIACYFVLVHNQNTPAISWLVAMGVSVFSFLCSWGIPKVAEWTTGWGDETEGLGPYFPLVSGWLLFIVFLVTGSQIAKQSQGVFIAALIIQTFLTALIIFIDYFFEEAMTTIVLDCFFHFVIALGIILYSLAEIPGKGQAWLTSFIIIFTANITTTGFFYFAHILWEFIDIDIKFWKRRGYIFAAQIITALILYIFPPILRLLDWFNAST